MVTLILLELLERIRVYLFRRTLVGRKIELTLQYGILHLIPKYKTILEDIILLDLLRSL